MIFIDNMTIPQLMAIRIKYSENTLSFSAHLKSTNIKILLPDSQKNHENHRVQNRNQWLYWYGKIY